MKCLAALAVLAMLTFGLTRLQAQSSATNTTPPAAAPGSTLTPELMSKILQVIAAQGTNRVVAAGFANSLGLTATGQGWPDRVTAAHGIGRSVHGFAVSRGSDQDVVVYVRRANDLHIFRAHRDGKIVSALISDLKTGEITMRTPDEAQKELDVELGYWADKDKLHAGGK